ncbi:hypothetical protein LOTGIDRAFT_221240 [Lottia gigantea]|uniref:Prosaposin n=1 Tax=Lottia gigantea TaxID=225164 RepID=V4B9V5_LOTGI|nr:hypothetical protein LOTGIDRAFT_221240 [Lottia gigantea]ESO85794.1 hypothetical protein LOTGIDRAFT_221240 [Lottia gigantea]
MKLLILLAILGIVCADEYLDDNHCEKGPTFWCTNLHYAKKCGAVKHCMDTVWTKQMAVGVNAEASCTVCQLMVDNVRQLVKNKATDNEMSNLIAKACHIMPSHVKGAQCKDAVKNNIDDILTLIKNEKMTSQMVCQLIGLCIGTEHPQQISKEFAVDVVKQTPADDKLCDDCKTFFNDLRDKILSNKTEEEFVETFYEVCAKLGGFEGVCKVLVDQFAPIAFKYLANEFGDVCQALYLCSNQAHENILVHLQQYVNQASVSGEYCDVCKTAVTEVRDLDRNPQVQSVVVNFLNDDVCSFLGQSADLCKQYVKAYAPILFQLISSELDPVKVCTEIGLCPGKQAVELKTPVKQAVVLKTPVDVQPQSPMYRIFESKPIQEVKDVSASVECVVCEFVMRELVKELGNNASATEIKAFLDKICGVLPSTISTECVQFVDQYAQVIISLLEQEIDPKVICTKIGLCTQTKHKETPKKVVDDRQVIIHKVSDAPLCDVCQEVVTYIDEALKSNASEQDIEMILERVCNVLPQTYRKQCDTIVESYSPYILQLLSELVDPKQICERLSLCPKPSRKNSPLRFKPHLVGERKCTFGPAYWCASKDNAKECGTTAHCEKHVWNN